MAKKRKTSKKAKQTKTAKSQKAKSAKAKTGNAKTAKGKSKSTAKNAKKRNIGSKASKSTKSGKRKEVKRQGRTGKRVSALDAAAQVLAKTGKPMRSRELITAMAEQRLWTSPGGKTPWATLYSAMTREIAAAGKESRFKKVDRGAFAATGRAR